MNTSDKIVHTCRCALVCMFVLYLQGCGGDKFNKDLTAISDSIGTISSIKYFKRMHNYNVYSLKSRSLLELESHYINKGKIYKAYYNDLGLLYIVLEILDGKSMSVRRFNENGKVIEKIIKNPHDYYGNPIPGEIHYKIEYKEDKVIARGYYNNLLWSTIVSIYKNDLLVKTTIYDLNMRIINYTVYNHTEWKHDQYNKEGVLLESGKMLSIYK